MSKYLSICFIELMKLNIVIRDLPQDINFFFYMTLVINFIRIIEETNLIYSFYDYIPYPKVKFIKGR